MDEDCSPARPPPGGGPYHRDMTWLVIIGLMLVAAAVAWYSVAVFIPMLRAKAARPAAITIVGTLSLVAEIALVLALVVEDGVWLLAGLAPWFVVAATPDTLVRVTGGPLPWDQVTERNASAPPAASDADGSARPRVVTPIMAAASVLIVALRTGAPVCAAAEAAAPASPPNSAAVRFGPPPSDLLLVSPGPEFTLVRDAPMGIEEAAGSRVDTFTLRQLRNAQFVEAHQRLWIRDDGTMLGNDVFRFETSEGAAEYHRLVTAYACSYSTETFDVPGGGVGLRIRYGSGDPIRDQVAWTDGNHRLLIAIGYQEAPANHTEALRLAARLRATARDP
jgi:hypothetical protein